MSHRPVYLYHLLATLVTCVLLCTASVVISLAAVRDSEKKFCSVLAAQDDPNPPTTERGASIARSLKDLSNQLHCPQGARS